MQVDRDADSDNWRIWRERDMKGIRWIAAAGVAVTAFATPALADVGVQLITTNARPGQTARLRVFAPAKMPLLLVTASRAPHPYPCRKNAICEPRSFGPPATWPYVRLRVVSRTGLVARFRVPALLPGRYRAVLYCEPCVRGRAGSLVVSDNSLVVRP